MDRRNYLAILWRRRWIFAITAAVTVAVAVLTTSVQAPQYAASTMVRVLTVRSGATQDVHYEVDYSDRLISTYAAIATSEPMVVGLARRLGMAEPPMVNATAIANSELMQLTVDAPEPALAARGVNILAAMLIARMKQDDRSHEVFDRQSHAIYTIGPAVVPQTPAKPRTALNAGLAILLGLTGGAGLAFLFENLDPAPLPGWVSRRLQYV